VHPLHQRGIRLRELRSDQWLRPEVCDSFTSIQSDPLALFYRLAAGAHRFCLVIDADLLCANDATLPPTARHNCCVTCFPAGCREDALRHSHPPDVLWARFTTDEDYLLALLRPRFCIRRGENDLTNRSSWYGIDAGCEDCGLERLPIHLRIDD